MTAEPGHRAQVLLRLGRSTEAATAARQGLASAPDDAQLHLLLAMASCEAGDHHEAVAAAERAVALRPEHALSHRTLGWATYKAGRVDEARPILERSLALSPDDATTHVMLGEVLLRSVPRHLPRRALRDSEHARRIDHHGIEAMRLAPDHAGGYLIRAKACVLAKDADGVSRWAKEAIRREPDNAVCHQLLGIAAQLRGHTSAAADHYVAAGKLNPRSDTSMKLLRGLRAKAPIGALLAFLLIRFIAAPFEHAGGTIQAVGALVIIAFLGYLYLVAPRRKARRAMSEEAQRVLARDQQLRRR